MIMGGREWVERREILKEFSFGLSLGVHRATPGTRWHSSQRHRNTWWRSRRHRPRSRFTRRRSSSRTSRMMQSAANIARCAHCHRCWDSRIRRLPQSLPRSTRNLRQIGRRLLHRWNWSHLYTCRAARHWPRGLANRRRLRSRRNRLIRRE